MTSTQFGLIAPQGAPNLFAPGQAAKIEQLGYSSIWMSGLGGNNLVALEPVLASTEKITVASGILNIWQTPVETTAAFFHRAEQRWPGRLLLGIGVGHPEISSQVYQKPLVALAAYLDALHEQGVPKERVVLAALRDKMLRLAADRAAGALPNFMPLAHTRHARQTLGPGPLLAVDTRAVFDTDPVRARLSVRPGIAHFLELTNYVNALREFGFPDLTVNGEVSDELVDAIATHGTPAQVAEGLRAHAEAGADHVVIHVLPRGQDPVPNLAALAKELELG